MLYKVKINGVKDNLKAIMAIKSLYRVHSSESKSILDKFLLRGCIEGRIGNNWISSFEKSIFQNCGLLDALDVEIEERLEDRDIEDRKQEAEFNETVVKAKEWYSGLDQVHKEYVDVLVKVAVHGSMPRG